eukprot:403370835
MIDLFWYIFSWVKTLVIVFLILDLVFIRTISIFYKKWYYERQGIPFCLPVFPLVGSSIRIKELMKDDENSTFGPFYPLIKECFGTRPPPITGVMLLMKPLLLINSPEYLQEIYISKNRQADKDPLGGIVTKPLLGDSIIVMQSNDLWKQKRHTLAAAFYKDKLIKMTQIIKHLVIKRTQEWREKFLKTRQSFDLMKELNEIHTNVIMSCAFGVKSTDFKMPYIQDGKTFYLPMGEIITKLVYVISMKAFRPEIMLFPYIVLLNYSKLDKEWLQNVKTMRDYAKSMILEKIQQLENQNMNSDQEVQDPDLLTILCQDPTFKDDHEMIISECIAFFIGGSQTVRSANANIIYYLTANQDILQKAYDELNSEILQNNKPPYDLDRCFDFEKMRELPYYQMIFNESLRIEPPLPANQMFIFTEDTQLGPYYIKNGEGIILNIQQIHHNPDQWQVPEKFIPERFDLKSSYYLTPTGQKRNPYSFTPFFGGKRICLGKTFAEIVAKFVVPLIIIQYEFEFVDKTLYKNKPTINVGMRNKEIELQVQIKESRLIKK